MDAHQLRPSFECHTPGVLESPNRFQDMVSEFQTPPARDELLNGTLGLAYASFHKLGQGFRDNRALPRADVNT